MGTEAAFIIAKQNQYIRRFSEASAVSPDTAVEPVTVGCRDSLIFRRLVRRCVFREAYPGRFFVDLAAAAEFRRRRLRRALVALLVVVAVAVVLIGLAGR